MVELERLAAIPHASQNQLVCSHHLFPSAYLERSRLCAGTSVIHGVVGVASVRPPALRPEDILWASSPAVIPVELPLAGAGPRVICNVVAPWVLHM